MDLRAGASQIEGTTVSEGAQQLNESSPDGQDLDVITGLGGVGLRCVYVWVGCGGEKVVIVILISSSF